MKKQFDVVVVGAGSAGLTTAVGFSKIGKSVLLIEKAQMGGECTNSGCIPSKALLHHAKTYYQAKTIAGENTHTETYRSEAFTYVRDTINTILKAETPAVFEHMGITVVSGEAEFVSQCAVRVGETQYEYKRAVIATGSHPRTLAVPGLEENHVLTNQNLFTLANIPERLLVIGSGPIGLEMGQAMAMLGSQVTIATIDKEFCHLEDPAIRPRLLKAFTDIGIAIHTETTVEKAENGEAMLRTPDGETRVPFDKVLVTIGREPNFPPGLEAAGIQSDERSILVDSQFRTSNKYVYAIGDVSQKHKFTHTADDTARQVVTRAVSRGLLRVNKKKSIPKVTYTMPEVAQVGLSEAAAAEKFGQEAIMRIEVPFAQNDRAITDSATEGLLIVIARRLNGVVLGAHIIGPNAGELLAVFSVALDQKISLWKLRRTIFAYPTYSLVIKKAGDCFFAQQVKDLKKDVRRVLIGALPKVITGVFWLTLILSFQHYRTTNDLSYQDVLFQLIDFFTSTLWGPIVYMGLYAVRPLILFPATLLTALSGALYGLWWGIFYTVIGENASANFAYWIGRFFGKDLRLEDSVIGNWIEQLRKNSFEAVLLMRLFYVPFDLTNYGSGVVQANWRSYFMATLIGIMPGLVTFVALGAAIDLTEFRENGLSFDAFDPRFLVLSILIFTISIIFSRALKQWRAEN